MVLFGGYEGSYLNDMHYINVLPFNIPYEPVSIHKTYLSMINKLEHADVCFWVNSESVILTQKQCKFKKIRDNDRKLKVYANS